MIIRIWKATATSSGAEKYYQHFRTTVLPSLRKIYGFCGAQVLEKDGGRDSGLKEIQVMTAWSSMERIRNFAGKVEDAVVEEEAREAVIDYDRVAEHWYVVEGL